ncbi:MAG: PglZ domain-containing protein [Muribaculaceae bacterium]|nr:PglZ domain-containing protein [Muribaculaceae bacterium]
MIEQWFKQDIEAHLARCKRVVVCDASGEGAFLLSHLGMHITVFTISGPMDEIQYRYEVEKHYADKNVVFYIMMPQSKITFLQEYANVGGLIDLTDMDAYIKEHLFASTGVNATVGKAELLLAAKLSVGKDENWWKGVATGISNPLNMDEFILRFLCDPEPFMDSIDASVQEVFAEELYKTIKKPKVKQTPMAMAKEVMGAILDGLAQNNISDALLKIYYALTDISSAEAVMEGYVSQYNLSKDISPLTAHYDHPFTALDEKLMTMLSEALKDSADITACLHAISNRIGSGKAKKYKSPWLCDLHTLFSANAPAWHKTDSVEDFAKLYQSGFTSIDKAMRKLYVAWLSKPDVLRAIQYYYEQLCKSMFDRWFAIVKDYKPTQKNLVVDALQKPGRVAVIVGDGLRLEIADEVARGVANMKDVKQDKSVAFAMLPSVTENGMSALYGCEGVELSAQARFKNLQSLVPVAEIIPLDSLNDSITAQKLVLTFGDIDQVGEKKQLAGLKDISTYPSQLIETIKQLLAMGFNQVFLTADHGFVITGILDEADKIPAPAGSDVKVGERFILANTPIEDVNLIERVGAFDGYAYQYYSQTDKPFVSRGAYGYAHGGLTPQECIIPLYCFSRETANELCQISIINKDELLSVTGSFFTVKIKAGGNVSDIFSASRKIKVQLFDKDGVLQGTNLLTLNAEETQKLEYEMVSAPCKLVITDLDTTEQLDSCEVGKSSSRDIDDLF